MIHRLKQVLVRKTEKEVSCYHNSTEIIQVSMRRMECTACSYVGDEFEGCASNQYIRNQEIDHNLELLIAAGVR